MSSNSLNVPGELNLLIADGIVTERAIQAMTQIDLERLHAAISAEHGGVLVSPQEPGLTDDESARLSLLAAQLTAGLQIEDDDRLKAIIESLNAEIHLSTHNIAELIHVPVEDVERVLQDPQSVPADVKLPIAIRCSYLMSTITQARGR